MVSLRITSKRVRLVLGMVAVLGLAVLYTEGALRHARRVNTSLELTDQGSYLEYVVNMRQTGYAYVGGRNQMPLYGFLQSLVHDPRATVDEAFSRSKQVNLTLSLLLLGALFWVWRRRFPLVQASAFLLVTGFTLFIFKAAYIQVELLYYTLAFGGFLLFCRLLEAPSWFLALATGVWVGLMHLAKAAALPALALFLGVGLLRAGWLTLRAARQESGSKRPALRVAGRELGRVGAVAFVFLLTVSPYLITNKRVFGHAFYNVNSTFYMWYERWPEAVHGTFVHGDRIGWPSLPPEHLPSLPKYLREHSAHEIGSRIWDGLVVLFGSSVRTYGYWKYVVFYAAVATVVIALHGRWTLDLLRRHFFAALFVLGYFLGYLVLFAWYVPVASGNRLILALFLPFMFVVGWLLLARARADQLPEGRSLPRWYAAVHWAMIAGVILELPDILTRRIASLYGGG